MKNIFKSLMLVAVAAMGFACQENMEGFTPERANEVVMTITADVDETRTYIDEVNRVVKWSEGDQLKVIENSAVYRTTEAATIDTDGKAKFSVSFPANTTASEFTYNAIFPASAVVEDDAEKVKVEKVKVIVKNQQKPTETSFDPQADVLVANQIVVNEQPTELNMQFKRLVAMGKMTIKGLPENAAISEVVFTAGANKVLAGRNYVNATTGKVLEYGYYGATNILTLTYDAPIATRDIYFVCNPVEMTAGEKFSVAVKSGDDIYTSDVEIPANRSLVFTMGDLSTFSVTVAKQQLVESAWTLVTDVNDLAVGDEIIIAAKSANYAMSTTQNTNNRAQAAITKNGDTVTFGDDVQVLTLENGSVAGTYAFNTGSGYLYAASSSKNYLKTQSKIDANASWKIEIASTGVATIKAQGSNTRNWLRYNSSNNPPLFACYSSGQADVVIYKYCTTSEGGEEPELPTEPVQLATPEVTATVNVNVVTLTWNAVEGASHYTVQVDDDVVESVEETTYTFTGDYEVEYMFTIKAIAADATKNTDSEAAVVTVTTEEESGDAPVESILTVAEFLALTDVVPSGAKDEEIAAAPLYTLKGTITSVTNTSYGNFYLNDGTGEVLIYGLVGPNGETKYWATSGAKVGDDITIKTIRTEYSNAPQGKNATFVELKSPGTLAFWTFDATAASFVAAGGEKKINVSIYNASSEVVAVSDNAQFSAAYANGVLTITALENTTYEAIEGNITLTCGTLSQVIAVSQAAVSTSGGEQTEVTAELQFVAANRTSWNTSQQTWEVEGVKLVNQKGSSTSDVANYVNPARFYKNSKITVTADGNITTIVFDCNSASYATALKSSITGATVSVSSDKVTVTLDGSSNEFVIASLTDGQVRMDSMTVTYLQ